MILQIFVYAVVWILLMIPNYNYAYDPEDKKLGIVLPPDGKFEAFYPRGPDTGSSRASHAHGSFYKFRHPGLVDAKNAAAYGYRFDGGRRFNYD